MLLPVVTILFSIWLTGETVTATFLAGSLLVLAGAYVGAIAPPDLLKRVFFWQRGMQN